MKLVGIAFGVTSVPSVTMSAQWEGLSLAAVAFLAHKDLIALRFSCRWLSSESSIAFATSKEAQERAALSRCDYDIWTTLVYYPCVHDSDLEEAERLFGPL